ncbi:hypothetical protein G9A89_017297 [Geosiphon pyriformis]|nr:hypothetical protein G9A89_017297 [Geosiphon pyriformis]
MQVTQIQLGVYANQRPFCLYLFPLVNSSPSKQDSSLSTPSPIITKTITGTQPFYSLRDIDVIFFGSPNGFVYNSGKIPQVFLDTDGYCFHERSGDIYLAASALSNTATRLGNHLLAEFCKLGKSELLSGMADCLLNRVSITRCPCIEAEFEFFATNIPRNIISSPTSTPLTPYKIQKSPRLNYASSSSGHLSPPAPVNIRKRMSLEEVLDNNNSNDERYGSRVASPVEHTVSPIESDRGNFLIKQEPSPSYFGSDKSNPASINMPNRSHHSHFSPNEITTNLSVLIDDDSRMRKKRRCAIPSITSNNIKATNNPEVMEKVNNTLKLKEQQKAIIEARQHQAQQQILQQQQNTADKRHSVAVSKTILQGASDNSKSSPLTSPQKRNPALTHHRSRNNRNSRNLSVFTPPYNNQNNLLSSAASPHYSPVPSTFNLNHHPSPIANPITPSLSTSAFNGFDKPPSNSKPTFSPAQKIDISHSASTSASIHGLISPQNVEFRSSKVSASPADCDNAQLQSSLSMAKLHEIAHSDCANKDTFINLFDSFHDTVVDSRNLKSTLEGQIRKTSTLLQTLQTSGTMIESLVRGHFREMQREVVKDLMNLEKRIAKIEREMRNSTVFGMSRISSLDSDRRSSDISIASSNVGYPHRSTTYSNGSSTAGSPHTSHTHLHPANVISPPLSAVSSNGEEDKGYANMLSVLKARLESLERRMSCP